MLSGEFLKADKLISIVCSFVYVSGPQGRPEMLPACFFFSFSSSLEAAR